MTAETKLTLRTVLLHARWGIGLTQEELAARCGLGVRTISDIERGQVQCPRAATLRRLALALGMNHEETRAALLLARTGGNDAELRRARTPAAPAPPA